MISWGAYTGLVSISAENSIGSIFTISAKYGYPYNTGISINVGSINQTVRYLDSSYYRSGSIDAVALNGNFFAACYTVSGGNSFATSFGEVYLNIYNQSGDLFFGTSFVSPKTEWIDYNAYIISDNSSLSVVLSTRDIYGNQKSATIFSDNAPSITSGGSGSNASVFLLENVTAVTTVAGSDPDLVTTLTFAIAGGADANLFQIDPSTGALSFKSPPIYVTPTDVGRDNVYDVVVQVSDGTLTDTQTLTVTVGPAGATFSGTAGSDPLIGADGDDVLIGLGSADTMDGKDGSDLYIINGSNEHKAAEIHDTGATGTDEVRFSAAKSDTLKIFAGDTGIERVVIGTGTGATADTSGTLSLNVDATKAVNGLTIIGNAGVNKLTGTAFSDTIDGGAGADKMTGGAGDDTYIVDNAKDAITEKATGGTDAVMASTGYTLSSNVENLTLTGTANIGGTGNSAANIIVGNDGNNTLNGAGGNDTLTGGTGADVFVFSAKVNAATNVDTITDFSSSDGDHLQFSLKQFKALGAVADLTSDQFWSGAGVTTAHDGTDRLVYNTTSGDLYYDADGVGAKYGAVLIAHLSGSPTISYADIQIIA